MMEYGCIGEKLTHSFSAEIHPYLADYSYILRELARDEVGPFLTAREFRGINVTIPYKQDVIPYLDEISPEALKIGAVNTIVNRDGRLIGFNTDFAGLSLLIRKNGIELAGKKVLVLGSGGTSKTAVYVAESMGAKRVHRVSRTAREDAITYEQARELRDTEVIINTTPCGMFPKPDDIPIDIDLYPALLGVVDAIYNPLRTGLVLKAKERNMPACGGLFMLIAQAAFACQHFIKASISEEKISRVFGIMEKAKENIVLTGMPGSGKTSTGKLLAKDLGRAFFDTDELIREKTGSTPADIIKARGESEFRDIESEVIAEASARQGIVLATGGGAVLREKNVQNLKRNGKIIFIDRPLDKLVTTADRPLSSDREKLRKRFEERYGIYLKTADLRHECPMGLSDSVKKIKELIL